MLWYKQNLFKWELHHAHEFSDNDHNVPSYWTYIFNTISGTIIEIDKNIPKYM